MKCTRTLNPLYDQELPLLESDAREFAKNNYLNVDLIVSGAKLARLVDVPGSEKQLKNFVKSLPEHERDALAQDDKQSPWKLPKDLYIAIIFNSLAAAIRGWDQVSLNGANLSWPRALHVPDDASL